MIDQTVGHYHIIERLGGGGMGVVYKAEDTKLGRTVALKFLSPELTRDDLARTRFLQEARAASQLDHPNICTVYEVGETNGQAWIAMACYEGKTLDTKIDEGPLPVDEALKIAVQIAAGLSKAHASNTIHRDIKPANVILTPDGIAKILDFGLAKLTDTTKITRSNTTLGTVAYMAPEQFRGGPVSPPTDLWSLGVVLFEMLTGKRPFGGDYVEAVAYAILNEQPPSLTELRPDAPAELDRVVKRMLRKDPLQRYQSAGEIIEELEVLRTPSSGSGRSDPRPSKPRESLPSGARLGPYEIVEPLGSGGMGDVYRARDTRLDRQVAIKVLAPEFSEDAVRKQRFQREAKTISSLSHSNICTLFDVGEQEGVDYLVMECLEGATLADRLTAGPLMLSELLKIGIQIGEALSAAHRQGVVHRDLKPGNVIITTTGVVKLLDFGLAKDFGAVTSTPRRVETPDKPLTAEGAIIGTLAYMAPEQVEGREADARSDIFALGAILYEMATGKRAFEGTTKASLIATILERDPPGITAMRGDRDSLSGSRRSLTMIEHIVRRCLEKDPERRWQNALDVANELRWVAERGVEDEDGAATRKSGVRWWMVAVLMFVALTAGVLLATFVFREPMPLKPLRTPTVVSVEAPEGQWLFTATPSRQGDRVLLDAMDETTNPPESHLWVRSMTTGELRRLNGTLNVAFPFWSPDGEWIAFCKRPETPDSPGRIMKVRADGSAHPVVIAEYPGRNAVGAWAPDATILFSYGSSIFRVPDTGGTPAPATTLEEGEKKHSRPCLLSDGRFVFYVAGERETEGLYVQGPSEAGKQKILAMKDPRPIIKTWTCVDDHILTFGTYPQKVTSRTLDLKTLALSEPREVDLPWDEFHLLEWSDLHLVAAVEVPPEWVSDVIDTRPTWHDRTGGVLESFGQEGRMWSNPSISPDERSLAFHVVSRGDPVFWDLVTYDSSGKTSQVVHRSDMLPTSPIWSADGRAILFSEIASRDDPKAGRNVLRKAIDGSGALEIVEEGAHLLDISRDGRWLLCTKTNQEGLWLKDLESSAGAARIVDNGERGELSPDANWLAYSSNHNDPRVYVKHLATGKTIRVSSETGREPRWRGDQRELFFLSNTGPLAEMIAVTIELRGDDAVVGERRVLFQASIVQDWNQCYGVTADGQRFITTTMKQRPTPRSTKILMNWFEDLD